MCSPFPNGELTMKRINMFGFFLLHMWGFAIRFSYSFSTSSIKMYTGVLCQYYFRLCFLHAHQYRWYTSNLHLFYSALLCSGLIAIAWVAGVSWKRGGVVCVPLAGCKEHLCCSQGLTRDSSPELQTCPKRSALADLTLSAVSSVVLHVHNKPASSRRL